ncbi:hypothetical protein KM043_010245 [Ampulex compressa]|nr:hypothetical protein KM043_010245 [Ampulex compressa]
MNFQDADVPAGGSSNYLLGEEKSNDTIPVTNAGAEPGNDGGAKNLNPRIMLKRGPSTIPDDPSVRPSSAGNPTASSRLRKFSYETGRAAAPGKLRHSWLI